MKTIFKNLPLLFAVVFMIGCKSSKPTTTITTTEPSNQISSKQTTILWTDHKPGVRQTMVKIDSSGQVKILAAQAPDPLKLPLVSDSALAIKDSLITPEEQPKILPERPGQSASLSVTKEALYRLSEAYFNGAIDSSAYQRLYLETINHSINLVAEEIELEEAKAETIQAETERLKVELQKAQLEFERMKYERSTPVVPLEEGEKEERSKEVKE